MKYQPQACRQRTSSIRTIHLQLASALADFHPQEGNPLNKLKLTSNYIEQISKTKHLSRVVAPLLINKHPFWI